MNILPDPDTTDDEKIQILTKVSENNRDNHSAFLIHILDLIPDNYTKEAKGKEESPIESVPDNRVMTAGTRTIEREGKKSAETKEDKRQKRRLPIVKILAFAILLFYRYLRRFFRSVESYKGGERAFQDKSPNRKHYITRIIQEYAATTGNISARKANIK